MNITTSQAPRLPLQRQTLARTSSEEVTLSSQDTFARTTRIGVGTGVGAAIGFGLGSAAAAGGFGGSTVGAITGLVTGAFIIGQFGDGKGGEGLVYPVAGAVIGGIGGAVLGAFGGDHMSWVGAAAGGLAVLQAMR